MKLLIIALITMTSLAWGSRYKAEFPMGPDLAITPGRLCESPDSYRYPERIAYCNREVDPQAKQEIFNLYRDNGYRLKIVDRSDYKIDHLIPLCAGGSNREENLWPQHKSLFQLTDPMESLGCEKLRQGKISQRDLVNAIIRAKADVRNVQNTIQLLKRL